MATVTVELEDSLLARAEDLARRRGTTLSEELRAFVEARASEKSDSSNVTSRPSVSQEFVAFVEGLHLKMDGDMPSRDERTQR